MRISNMKKAFSRVVSAFALAGIFAVSTLADEFAFFAPIEGSNPNVTIAGVPSGGAPWVVRRGVAVLNENGKLRVDVRGLVLPSAGNTAGPITQVAASVVCGDTVAATSGPVPLTTTGDAEIHAKLTLPSPCFGTIVLVRVAGVNGTVLAAPSAWIAATSVAKDADDDHDHDHDHNHER
jgi:hypothetical protein